MNILEFAWSVVFFCGTVAFGATVVARSDGEMVSDIYQRYVLLAVACFVGFLFVSYDIVWAPFARAVADVLPGQGTGLHAITTWLIVVGIGAAVFASACAGACQLLNLLVRRRGAMRSAER